MPMDNKIQSNVDMSKYQKVMGKIARLESEKATLIGERNDVLLQIQTLH